MTRYRVHCWMDIEATESELAKIVATTQLASTMKRTENDVVKVVRFGLPGTPVDLAAREMQNNPRGKLRQKTMLDIAIGE